MMEDKETQQEQDKLADEMVLNYLLKDMQERQITFRVLLPGPKLRRTGTIEKSEQALIERYTPLIIERLMQGKIEVCPNPDAHRRSWYYAGNGAFTCEICKRYSDLRVA